MPQPVGVDHQPRSASGHRRDQLARAAARPAGDGPGALTRRGLHECESARLFAERATHRSSAFALAGSNGRAVADICRRLDGIPLAIELAAARTGTLTAEQISARLSDSLKLLT